MEILVTLQKLGTNLLDLGWELRLVVAYLALPIVWIAWWLWGVNWRKAWPVLAQGAWVPLVLLCVLSALVWAKIAGPDSSFLGMPLKNYWCHLGGVGMIVGIALFCGWLQTHMGWSPPEISLEPPAGHDAHHDDHGHGHESAHASHDPGHAAHH